MKITFYNLQKGIRYLRNYGLREFFIRLSEKENRKIFLIVIGIISIRLLKMNLKSRAESQNTGRVSLHLWCLSSVVAE